MFSVLGGTINALIDSVFVSQKLGGDGLAAINVSMPVYLLICTLGSLIAGGASTASAQAGGKDDMEKAEEIYQQSFVFSVAVSLGVAVICAILCRPIAFLLAGSSGLYDYVYSYCIVIILGMVFTVLLYFPSYYLQLDGKADSIAVMFYIAIGTDIILDYLLMYSYDMGMRGAALASVLSTAAATIYGFILLENGYSSYHLKLCKPDKAMIKEILRLGSPAALTNLVDAIRLLALNGIILYVGGAYMMAVWAVLNTLSEFAVFIISGVPQAAAPMTSAYHSAKENSGLRILVALQVSIGGVLALLYAVIIIAGHSVIEMVFAVNEDLSLAMVCLGVYCVLELLCNIWTTFFQSVGRIFESNFLIVCRKFAFPILAALILASTNTYEFFFLPVGAILTLLVGTGYTVTKSIKSRKDEHFLSWVLLLDDYLEREHKVLDFSIVPDSDNICYASENIKEFCEGNELDRKQAMKLSLAIEEILNVYASKNHSLSSVDMRAFALQGSIGIRIRCAGVRYNPFAQDVEEEDDFLMGVTMIRKMSEVINYNYLLGTNNLLILFEQNREEPAKEKARAKVKKKEEEKLVDKSKEEVEEKPQDKDEDVTKDEVQGKETLKRRNKRKKKRLKRKQRLEQRKSRRKTPRRRSRRGSRSDR
jgi:Na+-driven multidrug efflux pump